MNGTESLLCPDTKAPVDDRVGVPIVGGTFKLLTVTYAELVV